MGIGMKHTPTVLPWVFTEHRTAVSFFPHHWWCIESIQLINLFKICEEVTFVSICKCSICSLKCLPSGSIILLFLIIWLLIEQIFIYMLHYSALFQCDDCEHSNQSLDPYEIYNSPKLTDNKNSNHSSQRLS